MVRRWFAHRGLDVILLILAPMYYAAYLKAFPLLLGGDEGYVYYVAFALAKGEIPYQDILLAYPPGYFYPFSLIFKQWGPSIIAARIFMLIGLSVTPWMFYRAARFVANQWLAFAAALIILLVPGPWERFPIGLLGVGLIWSCLAALNSPSRGKWIVVGAVIGLAFLLRMDMAIGGGLVLLTLCGVQPWVLGTDGKEVLGYFIIASLAAIFVALPMFVWLTAQGILQEHIGEWLRFVGLVWERSVAADRMDPPPLAALASFSLKGIDAWVFYGSFVPVALLCLKAVHDARQRPSTVVQCRQLASIIVVIAWSVLNLPQYAVERPDSGHLTRHAFTYLLPFVIVMTDATTRLRNQSTPLKQAATIAVIAFLSLYGMTFVGKYVVWGGGAILTGHGGSIAWLRARVQWYSLSNGISYPMWVLPDLNKLFEHIIRKTEPEEPLACLPYHAEVNFLTQRLCPTRYVFLYSQLMRPGVEDEYIEQIRLGRVPFIFIQPAGAITGGKPTMLKDFAPRLEAEIASSYRISATIPPSLFFLVHQSRLQ